MTEQNQKPILIAIDHGYGNVKTPHFIFPTGVTAYSEEPAMSSETLNWAGRWYAIGDSHKEFIADKTTDEDYLKLTMVAVAKELNRRGLTEAPVYLAAVPANVKQEDNGAISDEDFDIADSFMNGL